MQKKEGDTLTPIQLTYLAAAGFSGPDSAAFLQSQLSADIEALAPGESTFAAFCTPRGQVLALLLVCREGDMFRVAASASLLPAVLERLRTFVFRSRVEFEQQPELGIAGVAGDVAGAFAPGPDGLVYAFCDEAVGNTANANRWKLEELKHNVAWLQPQTSEKFIPQMLGLDAIGAVSFTKGCYPGQEIVARARYLGRVKRKPLKLVVDELPKLTPGQKVEVLRDGEWAGAVLVDWAPEADGGGLLYTVAADDPKAPATMLRVDGNDYRCATI